jgi:glycosyltransferase involved in cell wall biosynthesis
VKVSVIVLTYNRAGMVVETIDSVLDQTFNDFELIIVDNCSQDNTKEIIGNYLDKRVRYYRNDNHGVIAVNRNFGIGQAQGEYIAFCDDDDLWFPEKLTEQVRTFEADSRLGLVCTNAEIFSVTGKSGLYNPHPFPDSRFTLKALLRYSPIICSSVMVRKSVIDDVGILDTSPDIFTAEDYEFWLRIVRKYRIKYLDWPLVKYRVHSGNVQKKSFAAVKRNRSVYRKLKKKGVIGGWTYCRLVTRSFLLELLWRTHTIMLASWIKRFVNRSLVL